MTAQRKCKPDIRWDQSAFEELKVTWSSARIAADGEILNRIFREAEASPVLMKAIAWAQQHGVQFFVDHQAETANGYYTIGTGVVAVTPNAEGEQLIDALAHELRHAWQDYNGLAAWPGDMPDEGTFADMSIKQALLEADATAFGELARLQAEITRIEKRQNAGEELWSWEKRVLAKKPQAMAETPILAAAFKGWFTRERKWHPKKYGDYFSKLFGRKWGLYEGELPPRNFEFQPVEPKTEGVDLRNMQDVLRLGVTFSGGKNYLAALQPDFLPRKVLRPELANTFWDAAGKKAQKLTQDLRKAGLKKKFTVENGRKHHPWP